MQEINVAIRRAKGSEGEILELAGEDVVDLGKDLVELLPPEFAGSGERIEFQNFIVQFNSVVFNGQS